MFLRASSRRKLGPTAWRHPPFFLDANAPLAIITPTLSTREYLPQMNKKHIAIAMLAIAAVAFVATPAWAHRYTRQDEGHPLRYIGYVVNAVGIGLEYAVTRPIHRFVSKPNNDIIFGHKSYVSDIGTYNEWVHGDYSPSIKAELAQYPDLAM